MNKFSITLFTIFFYVFSFSQNYDWVNNFAGTESGASAYSNALITDAAGNSFFTGSYYGTVDFDPGPNTATLNAQNGGGDIFLAKFDAAGNYVWVKSIGEGGDEVAQALYLDAAGNIYLIGEFGNMCDFDPGAGTATLVPSARSIFLAKYDPSGNFIWVKNFGDVSTASTSAFSSAIKGDAAGNIYAIGIFNGTIDVDPGSVTNNFVATNLAYNSYVSKYDAAGNYLWSKQIQCSNSLFVRAMEVDANGNFFITGAFTGVADLDPGPATSTFSSNFDDLFMAKYDNSGNYQWGKIISTPDGECGRSMCLDAQGNVYLAGYFQTLTDMDPGPATATITTFPSTINVQNGFIAKYDNAGNYVWAKAIQTPSYSSIDCIRLDASGSLIVAGSFRDTLDVDPGPGVVKLGVQGYIDLFVAKYSNAGNYLWALDIGGSAGSINYSSGYRNVGIDATGNVYVAGTYSGTVDFDPGPSTQHLSSNGTLFNLYLARYSGISTSLQALPASNHKLGFYPNPCKNQGWLFLELKTSVHAQITLYDASGRVMELLEEAQLSAGNHRYELKLKEQGVYFVRTVLEGVSETKKIVVVE